MALPPPTINTLDPYQRMRLVRSNRKLEAVLGTAPYLIDEVYTPRHSPTPSISSDSSSDDANFFIAKNSRDSPSPPPSNSKSNTELTRPLLRRLRTVPVPVNIKLTPRRLSARSRAILPVLTAVSPVSPTFTISLATKQATQHHALPLNDRRRKMAKLTRTLGGNIPPELVFRSEPSVKPTQGKPMQFTFPLVSTEDDVEAITQSTPMPSPPYSTPVPKPVRPRLASISGPRPRTHSRQNSTSFPVVAPTTTTESSGVTTPTPVRTLPKTPSSTTTTTTTTPPASTLAERRRLPRPRSLSFSSTLPSTHTTTTTTTTNTNANINPSRALIPLVPLSLPPPTPSPHPSDPATGHAVEVEVDVSIARASYRFDPARGAPTVVQVPDTTTTTNNNNNTSSTPPAGVEAKVLKALDVRQVARSPAPFSRVRVQEHRPTRSEPSPPAGHLGANNRRGGEAGTTRTRIRIRTRTIGVGAGRRKEKEWSGEWNKADMDEVARALRGLKALGR